MSIDKSLRRKNSLQRSRNVLTRGERITQLKGEERWEDGRSPYGLPKVKVIKIIVKKAKKKEDKAAEVSRAMHPSAQRDRLSRMLGAQRAGLVGSKRCFERLWTNVS